MAEFASKGWASLNTVLGSIGTAGTTGILGNLFGGNTNCGCSENNFVNRYELQMQHDLAAKDGEIALLKSTIYVDTKIADVYERLNTKIGALEKQCCDQAVFNATVTSTQSCIANQVNALLALTKLVVPITSVCPQPAVATTTATTT